MKEYKVLRLPSNTPTYDLNFALNHEAKEGWVLLDVLTAFGMIFYTLERQIGFR